MTYSLPQSWLDAMLEAVCLVDETSLHILAANHAVAELVGKPVHELVNTPVQSLAATPQDFVFWSQPVQALAEGIHSETSVLHASGALVPVERSVRGVTLPNGGAALLLTMIDLTAQRSTERELETLLSELRATLDSAADGMLVCAMDGSIRAFNQRLVNIWRIPAELLTRRDDVAVLRTWQNRCVRQSCIPSGCGRLLPIRCRRVRTSLN